ncbi:uncharacterized protein LOC131947510 [Physella acuta]|uniref:uncharacterized protein LOC131947510 n=1 Tax=Physella acuta TaxID=109671 RepID=UPI0027DC0602|nr:uncharacterized protein LOC131947510 [Physella acuta]
MSVGRQGTMSSLTLSGEGINYQRHDTFASRVSDSHADCVSDSRERSPNMVLQMYTHLKNRRALEEKRKLKALRADTKRRLKQQEASRAGKAESTSSASQTVNNPNGLSLSSSSVSKHGQISSGAELNKTTMAPVTTSSSVLGEHDVTNSDSDNDELQVNDRPLTKGQARVHWNSINPGSSLPAPVAIVTFDGKTI